MNIRIETIETYCRYHLLLNMKYYIDEPTSGEFCNGIKQIWDFKNCNFCNFDIYLHYLDFR